jgi:hypothetical protein
MFHGVLLNASHIEKYFTLNSQILIYVFYIMNHSLYDDQFPKKSVKLHLSVM